MDTILTFSNERLGALSSTEAVSFFRALLWAEARRIGVPLSKIHISLWTDVADGGIDAAVEENEKAFESSGLIKSGYVGYQIKTGTSFKPWQKALLKAELFGEKEIGRDNLGRAVRACLDKKRTYVLVCFGVDFTEQNQTEAVANLLEYFAQCGYTDAKVEIWNQSAIVGFAKIFPSIVLQLKGLGDAGFQTHKSWGQNDDMRNNFKYGKPQEDIIEGVRVDLRRNDNAIHVRLWGEPGAGKTRLAFEATLAEDLLPLVVYCDAPSKFRDSNLMNELVREDSQLAAILVIDECDPVNREYIWNILKNHGPRIKLVTIFNERDDTSGRIGYFEALPLEKDEITSIIIDYGVLDYQAGRWAELCSGSPRVAHVIGWNLQNNPEDVLKPLDTVNIWDRYVVGRDEPSDIEVKQRKLVLQHIALFKRFGFGKAVIAEGHAISKMIEQADPQITWARFQYIVKRIRDRKILQGETTLYITPKALHVQLWKEWWETYGDGFDFEVFFQNLPDPLNEWYFEMFKYAAESKAASRIVAELLGENGPFQKQEFLRTRIGSDFFLALTEANPEAAVRCLQKTVGVWSYEELIDLLEPRRSIVWALERIVIWKNSFLDAARLLLLLGEAENETYGNNASGTFAGLFSPGPGAVAPTEASPEERFPVLQEAINSESKSRRLLGFRAADAALETYHFSRAAGPEHQGLRHAQLWVPKNREEMIDAYRRVWQFLFSKLDELPADEQETAMKILLANARGLTRAVELAGMIIRDIKQLSEKPFVDQREVLRAVEHIVHYSKNELSAEIAQQWETLRDALVGNDFSSLMRRYVGMDLLEDSFDEDGNHIDKADLWIKNLAQQAIADNELFKRELPWLVTTEAKNGYKFGYELATKDVDFSLLQFILEAQSRALEDENVNDFFLGGYLRVLFERNSESWESTLDLLATDQRFAPFVPVLTWRSGMSDKAALRILLLATEGIVGPSHFRVFGFASVIANLSEEVFTQWIEFLLSSSERVAVSIALDLYHFFYCRKDPKFTLPKELTHRLLTHPFFFKSEATRKEQMEDFHWTRLAIRFVERYPEDSLILADIVMQHFGEKGTIVEGYRSGPHEVLNAISKRYPSQVWQRLTMYLGPPIDARSFHLNQWLKGDLFGDKGGALLYFDPNDVWKWVDEDVYLRAWYLAGFVPKELFRGEGRICWARELLKRYGDRDEVRAELMGNFGSEGWAGPASLHYQGKKNWLLAFREGGDNPNVLRWIDDYIEMVNRDIERAKIEEERYF